VASRTLSFSLLQLGEAKRRPPVLSSARPLISPASGDLLGLGCEGDLRFSARWCRLGTSLSRFVFPVVDGEAAAAAWNKSLQPCPRLGGACSGASERFVRVESTGPVRVALSRFALVLAGSGIGCASNRHPGMDWGSGRDAESWLSGW